MQTLRVFSCIILSVFTKVSFVTCFGNLAGNGGPAFGFQIIQLCFKPIKSFLGVIRNLSQIIYNVLVYSHWFWVLRKNKKNGTSTVLQPNWFSLQPRQCRRRISEASGSGK